MPGNIKDYKTNKQFKASDLGQGSSFASYSKLGQPLMAKFLERFIAYIIDFAIGGFILSVFSIIVLSSVLYFMHFTYGEQILKSILTNKDAAMVVIIVIICDIFISCFYFIYYDNKSGQTPGKMIMNLKVVKRNDLSRLPLSKIIVRETIGRLLSSSIFFIGYFYYYYNPKRQTFHDVLADSIVVVLDNEGEIMMTGSDTYTKDGFKAFLPPFIILLVLLITALLSINVLQFVRNIELRNQVNEVLDKSPNIEIR